MHQKMRRLPSFSDSPMANLQSEDPSDRDECIASTMDEEEYEGDISVMMSERGRPN